VKGDGLTRSAALVAACEIALVGLAAIHGSVAWAAEPSRVLVEGPAGDPVTLRLVSELRSSGLVVWTAEREAEAKSDASASQVDAVVRVGPASLVRVWWVDRTGVRVAEPEVMETHPGEDPAVGAVRTAEVLRARLLHAERAPLEPPAPLTPSPVAVSGRPPAVPAAPTPTASTAAPPTLAPLARRTPRAPPSSALPFARLGIDAGGLAMFTPGGVPPALDLALMARWRPVSRLTVRALVTVPVARPSVSSIEGRANVGVWLVGGAVEWGILRADSPWTASFGVGAAAARVQTDGVASLPYVSATGDAWTSLPFVEATAGRAIGSPHVHAGVQLLLGTAGRQVGIRFADREVARWGALAVGTGLCVQIEAY